MPQQTYIVDSNKTSTTSVHVLYIMFELHILVHVQYIAIVHTNTRRIDRFSEKPTCYGMSLFLISVTTTFMFWLLEYKLQQLSHVTENILKSLVTH